MNKYDLFKSEGGYRVYLGVWSGSPVVSCPWLETKEEAEELVRYLKELVRYLKKEEESEADVDAAKDHKS